MQTSLEYVANGDGWEMALRCTRDPSNFRKDWRPLVIVPGYAMNSHIFGFHPTGLSMEAYFAKAGFEVWSVDMRNQGAARCTWGHRLVGLQDLALTDLPIAFEHIVRSTKTEHDRVDVLGASLGGTLLFIHVTMFPEHRVASMVALGAPLRWIDIHPVIRVAFASPKLVGMIPIRHTRTLAGWAAPLLVKVPAVMKIYLHPNIVDTSQLAEMVPTVDDPNPRLNRQLAYWMRRRDLVVEGINVCQAFAQVKNPLFCVLANADGIVLPRTASSALELSGAKVKDRLEVGTETLRFAHADLFVSDYAQEMVFSPISKWLQERYQEEV